MLASDLPDTTVSRVLEAGDPRTRWSWASRPATTCRSCWAHARPSSKNDRESMTITVPRVDAGVVGGLIDLFKRTLGLYASLVGINAYHQPGVEAGKKAAASVLTLQGKVLAVLLAVPQAAEPIAIRLGVPDAVETIFLLFEHLAANRRAEWPVLVTPAETTFIRT